jgi:uncharacterized protein involved in exopolysaccharide biosynthesis
VVNKNVFNKYLAEFSKKTIVFTFKTWPMPDIFDLFLRWWKQIIILVITTVVITAIIVYTMPKKYLGVTTALPAPTYASDKAAVFSQNLQVLYPGLGTADDLDMILGTAHLDTVYLFVADELNLVDYYGMNKSDGEAKQKAASILKNRTRVTKSDYGELKVKAWDGDRNQAAAMANAVMEKLQQVHQDVQTANNVLMLSKIKEEYAGKQAAYQQLHDSLNHANTDAQLLNSKQTSLIQQMQEYEKLINQYQLMVNAKPRVLVVVEKANAPLWPDKPKPKETILAAFFISLFFGLFAALILERRRMLKN